MFCFHQSLYTRHVGLFRVRSELGLLVSWLTPCHAREIQLMTSCLEATLRLPLGVLSSICLHNFHSALSWFLKGAFQDTSAVYSNKRGFRGFTKHLSSDCSVMSNVDDIRQVLTTSWWRNCAQTMFHLWKNFVFFLKSHLYPFRIGIKYHGYVLKARILYLFCRGKFISQNYGLGKCVKWSVMGDIRWNISDFTSAARILNDTWGVGV